MESHLTNKQRSLLAAALFLGAILPFLPTLPFGFVGPWDDSNYIVQNPWLGNLSLERILRAFLQPYYFNYHPLTILTYQLEYAVWGPWAPGFRTVNFIIHAATTVALLWMLRQFGSATFPSVILALFFAIHPLRVESVVWVSERKDVLCALFYVLALGCWRRSLLWESSAGERRWLGLAVACTCLALLSKAMAVSLPLVFLAHDATFARERLRRRLPLYLLLIALGVAFSYLNLVAQRGAIHVGASLQDRLLTAAFAPIHYIYTTVLPIKLSAIYPMTDRPTLAVWGKVAAGFSVVGGLCLLLIFARQSPRAFFSLLASAIALGPVSGIVGVGSAWAADRYSLIPTALLLIAFVGPLDRALRARQRFVLLCAVVILLGLASITIAEGQRWRSPLTLWQSAADRFPNSFAIRAHLAEAFSTEASRSADPARAAQLRQRALELSPADGRALVATVESLVAKGSASVEVQALLRRALAEPNIKAAIECWVWIQLAVKERAAGNVTQAEEYLTNAFMEEAKDYPATEDLLFVAWHAEQVGRLAEAKSFYTEVLLREPVNASAHQGIAFVHLALGDLTSALASMTEAARLLPEDTDIQNNLRIMQSKASGSL
jgi:Tfp pilus assembly protein PilF